MAEVKQAQDAISACIAIDDQWLAAPGEQSKGLAYITQWLDAYPARLPAIVNQPFEQNVGGGKLVTTFLLYGAARSGRAAAVEVLLKKGADVKMKLADGNTPLHVAAFRAETANGGHAQVVQQLLAAGADAAATNQLGELPGSVGDVHRDVLRLLSERRAAAAAPPPAPVAPAGPPGAVGLSPTPVVARQRNHYVDASSPAAGIPDLVVPIRNNPDESLQTVEAFTDAEYNVAAQRLDSGDGIGSPTFVFEDDEHPDPVGSGSYAFVYKLVVSDPAHNLRLRAGQSVAVKVAKRGDAGVKDELMKLHEVVRVRHPNLTSFYGLSTALPGPLQGRRGLIFEYADKGSLKDTADMFKKKSQAHLPLALLRSYDMQMLQGLAHLDSLGLVHRDFKTANVLVCSDGTVKVGDFGSTVKAEDAGIDGGAGSRAYLAPEAMAGATQTIKGDVWSLGVTVWELLDLTTRPWAKQLPNLNDHTLTAFVTQTVKNDSDYCPIPPHIKDSNSRELLAAHDFVCCCLRKDPELRPDVRQLMEHDFILGKGRQLKVAHAPASIADSFEYLDLDLRDPTMSTALLWGAVRGVNQLWKFVPVANAFPAFKAARIPAPAGCQKVIVTVQMANHVYCLRTLYGVQSGTKSATATVAEVQTIEVNAVNEAMLDDVSWIRQSLPGTNDNEFVLRPCGVADGHVLVWLPHPPPATDADGNKGPDFARKPIILSDRDAAAKKNMDDGYRYAWTLTKEGNVKKAKIKQRAKRKPYSFMPGSSRAESPQ